VRAEPAALSWSEGDACVDGSPVALPLERSPAWNLFDALFFLLPLFGLPWQGSAKGVCKIEQ